MQQSVSGPLFRSLELSPSDCTFLVCIPGAIAPVFLGAVEQLEQSYYWANDEEWERGYNLINQVRRCALAVCAEDIVREIRRARGVKPDAPVRPEDERESSDYATVQDVVDAIGDGGVTNPTVALLRRLVNAVAGDAFPAGPNGEPPALTQEVPLSRYIEEVRDNLQDDTGAVSAYNRLDQIRSLLRLVEGNPPTEQSAAELINDIKELLT